MRMRRLLAGAGLAVLGLASTAFAQGGQRPSPTTPTDWSHGSTLALFAGSAVSDGHSAGLAGAAIGWELTPRWSIEGTGEWQEWGRDPDGFGASVTTHYGLWRTHNLMPTVLGGVGVFRASFDEPDGALPAFYSTRVSAQRRLGAGVTFTDPSVIAGFGLAAFVSRHWSLQPDLRAVVVTRHDHAYTRTTFTVRVVYHFEDHPVTPSKQ